MARFLGQSTVLGRDSLAAGLLRTQAAKSHRGRGKHKLRYVLAGVVGAVVPIVLLAAGPAPARPASANDYIIVLADTASLNRHLARPALAGVTPTHVFDAALAGYSRD